MAHRQIETTSIHSSTYHTGWIRISPESNPWQVVAAGGDNNNNLLQQEAEGENVLPCTYLDLATLIHMQQPHRLKKYPSNKSSLRWNKDTNFHENLRLPDSTTAASTTTSDDDRGILVLFEAMASEGVAMALSSKPGFQRGSTIEITFGAVGNTKTTILKKSAINNNNDDDNSQQQPKEQQVSIPCRVCQEGTWNSFWVCKWKGKTYAGVGHSPGEKCLAILKDDGNNTTTDDQQQKDETTNSNNNSESAIATTENENNTNNNDGTTNATTTDTTTSNAPIRYVGVGNAAQQGRTVRLRSLYVTFVPSIVSQQLEMITDYSLNNSNMTMDVDDHDDEALKEYQEQCRKAKARAEKFGIEYKEPQLHAVVPWSQARKLRANPQKGFITGIDVTDPEELAKQEARKSRFGSINSKKRELEETKEGDDEDDDDNKNEDGEKVSTKDNNNDKEGETNSSNPMMDSSLSVPIIQAWDNEELVRFQRVDPPSTLWKNPPPEEAVAADDVDGNNDAGGGGTTTAAAATATSEKDEFAMETDKPTLAPEKIHVFSIDWSAFKQIRTEDLMAHFNIYGPSYVEWLGDLGCNILFEDKFSAVRAMKAMAQELPSPPPASLNEADDEYVPPDFGAMGWKLGHGLVRKIKNDRFGRRGTTARILMRPATSLDILVERPSSWPDPPPGFSAKRILGPGSDYNTNAVDEEDNYDNGNSYNTGRKRKRRRRNSDRERTPNNNNNNNNQGGNNNKRNRNGATGKRRQRAEDSNAAPSSAADRLNQGLSSSRAGFTLEEMEALRAAKKNSASTNR